MSAQPDNVIPLIDLKPHATVVAVSPETAKRWLERNENNRKIRPSTVAKYARDMASGKWKITGEAVKFTADGTLLDGQHRLAAIVKADVTVQLVVIRGIAPEAQRVMDTGRARTAADALAMKGEANASLLSAMAKLAIAVEEGAVDPGRYEVTHAEVEQWVSDHPSAAAAVEVARYCARRTDCPPSVVAYTYWRLAQIDTQEAVAFWTAAADKVGLRVGDPVIALTNRFAEARRNREVLSKRIYLSLIYRAWNTRRDGKSMRFLRVNSPAGGLVPVPDPK